MRAVVVGRRMEIMILFIFLYGKMAYSNFCRWILFSLRSRFAGEIARLVIPVPARNENGPGDMGLVRLARSPIKGAPI